MPTWIQIEKLLHEMTQHQNSKLLSLGQQMIPSLTADDLLQPNDFTALEFNPHFRYQEGVLAGIQTVQTALLALKQEKNES